MLADPELARVQILIDLGRVPAARESLGRVLAQDPTHVRALCMLALCHEAAGEPAAMLSAAERASADDPTDEWAHRLRSSALRQLERAEEAAEAARMAIRLAPEGWQGYAALALARGATPAGRRASFAAGSTWHAGRCAFRPDSTGRRAAVWLARRTGPGKGERAVQLITRMSKGRASGHRN